MYNTTPPKRSELPTSAQLMRSTIIAALSALVLLVVVILPSEYGVDATGMGRVLGLTQMGEIKTQLAKESAEDATATAAATPAPTQPVPSAAPELAGRMDEIERKLTEVMLKQQLEQTAEATFEPAVNTATPPVKTVVTAPVVQPAAPAPEIKSDQTTIELAPGEGVEVKLVMKEGKTAFYRWTANGSVLNYDTHGDGNGRSISYVKGRGIPQDEGELTAAFDGNHGWFWRNRTNSPVTLSLETRGDYEAFKRLK
ncbi:hypothetical protein GCM10007094_32600 [Pseudovibrio japonicus]|uniref:Transmembrane anchor protein n=1 Tax=Pseudovibrio japonicus TaxID=366534 RepID=A0ABQ3ELN0_9HYPH|nr:hypothetical protein [Pseudovibrio japonicus]GHB40667.1 hypothetical protein GCM10007094_32600 [Pseudovibrio japonicus]